MNTTLKVCARLNALLFILLFCSTAFAGSPKVEVCHIPPDDPDNYHTIKINEKALAAHLAHFDLVGACNEMCAQLCDDGNACTIDHSDDCEQNGCPVISEPVDCGDSDACTDDACDPVSGCFNPVAVTCEAPDLCTSSTCDPTVGVCEDTPVLCDEGETCNPDNGLCESDGGGEPFCACFDSNDLQALGEISSCGNNHPFAGMAAILYTNGNIACSGVGCTVSVNPGCGTKDGTNILELPVNDAEDAECRALIVSNCPDSSAAEGASANAPAVQYTTPLLSN